MRTATYYGIGDVRFETRDRPLPGPGEVLVRVGATGICGSDATEYLRGPQLIRPGDTVVLGHEFAGWITEVGPGVAAACIGQLVACGAGISCGECARCVAGRTNLCLAYHTIGFHRDGGLAEYVTAPAGICVPVGDRGLSVDTAALAQPMAVAMHALGRGGVVAGSVVLIIGVGGIGSFLTYACVAAGADVWVTDVTDERLDLARSLGAAHVVDARSTPASKALQDADVVFEVSGTTAGMAAAIDATRPGARLVLVGIQKAPYPMPAARLTLQEVDTVGTVAHVCAHDLPAALDVLASRESWADIAPTVYPLSAVVDEGLVPLGNGHARQIKTLFDPSTMLPRPADHSRLTGKES